MRLLHSAKDTSAQFDDPNLVSCAGLVPVMRLAQDCDLAGLVAEHLKMTVAVGANAHLKIPGIVAGMLAGADSIDDLDVLRHGGMGELFGGVRAPSTLGSFLRGLHWGNVRQLEVVSRRLLAELAAATPMLADAHVMAHLDIDSAQRRVYGHTKQGAGFGAAKVGGYTLRLRGLNAKVVVEGTTCTSIPRSAIRNGVRDLIPRSRATTRKCRSPLAAIRYGAVVVTSSAKCAPAIAGACLTRSNNLSGSVSTLDTATRIAPRSRRWRVRARVSTSHIPTTPCARSSASRLRRDRQLEGTRAASRIT